MTKETLSKCIHLSEEDKGGKMAAADSVQQRRQYRRQNQQSSSGMDTGYIFFFLHILMKILKIKISESVVNVSILRRNIFVPVYKYVRRKC